jgi:hypothetical protein
MCHTVCCTLSIVHFLVVLGSQIQIVVVRNQPGKGMRGLNNAVCMLIEHFKKIAFPWQQFPKQHDELQSNSGPQRARLRLRAV